MRLRPKGRWRRGLRARTRPVLLYQTVESLVAHQLLKSVGELGCIEGIGGWRPPAMVMPAIGHGEGGQGDQRLVRTF